MTLLSIAILFGLQCFCASWETGIEELHDENGMT